MNSMNDATIDGMRFHPEYNSWVQPAVLIMPSLVYVVVALIGHHVMKHRQVPVWVDPCMRIYNVVQILVCLYMSIGLLPVVQLPNLFGVSTDFSAQGEWFVFVHYLSKFLDWFDTLWMILKRKGNQQMSFLHLYHHATIGVVWGYLLSTGCGSGTTRYGAFINSVTHVLMYGHYLWTSFGLKNPFKRMLTYWQIGQFYSCFLHAIIVLCVETVVPRKLAWHQFCYHITMIYLFTWKLNWVPGYIQDLGPTIEKSSKTAEKKVR